MTTEPMHPEAIATMKEMVEVERHRLERDQEEKRASVERERLNDERWARGIALSAACNLFMGEKAVKAAAVSFTRYILTGSFDDGGEA